MLVRASTNPTRPPARLLGLSLLGLLVLGLLVIYTQTLRSDFELAVQALRARSCE